MRKHLLPALLALCILSQGIPETARSAGVELKASAPETGAMMARIEARRLQRETSTQTTTAARRTKRSITQIAMTRREERLSSGRRETSDTAVEEFLIALNKERARHGKEPLQENSILTLAARRHAQDMVARKYFDHENPEGERVGERVRKAGYGMIDLQKCQCSYTVSVGENLAKGQRTPAQVIEEWFDSPPHRETMLSDLYTEAGIGIAGDVWVLNLGIIVTIPVSPDS